MRLLFLAKLTVYMKKVPDLRNIRGFSLIEVLVFITIISLFFITAVTITVFSLKNSITQQYRILATRFAEEGMEWVKQEKEDDWQVIALHDDSGGAGVSFCLNSLDWNTKTDCNGAYSLGPPNIFKRVLIITNSGNPVDRITVNVTVSWLENTLEQQITLKSVLNLWE